MIPVCNLGKAKTMEEAFEMLQTLKEDIAHGIATMDLSLSGDFKLFGDYYE
jgi:predicted house-cleaning NTP pyrophosphatase (Maf/HAM1 superfamily)